MRRNRIHVKFIMALVIGVMFQSFSLPALGSENFNLGTISIRSEIDLDWTPVSGATSYDIYRSPSQRSKLATVKADRLWYRDHSVVMGERYTYWIIAQNGDSQLATSNFSESIAGGENDPSTPTLRAKAFSTPYVELTWGGLNNALRYEIERKTGDYDFHTIVHLDKKSSYQDMWVSRGSTYTYRIRAFNAYGRSDYSKEVTVSIKPEGTKADVPANFSARDDRYYRADSDEVKGNKQIVLSWRYDDNDADSFIIEKKPAGGEYAQIARAIPGINIFTNRRSGAYNYDSSASHKTYYYYDTNISDDSTYYYRIKAYNRHGESDYAREVRVATLVTKRPLAPSNLKAEAVPGKVNLTWSNNSGNEDGFRIERRADRTQSFTEAGSVNAGATSWCDTSFLPNTAYHYRIKAVNKKGASNYSQEAQVVTLSAPPKTTPTGDKEINKPNNVYILLLYSSPKATSVSRIKFLTTPPVHKSATTFLPIRDIANLFESAIQWDDSEQKVTLKNHNQTVEAWTQKNTARINGSFVAVDTNDANITPIIEDRKYMMFPLQLIEKGFNCKIDWQANDKFIKVFINK